MSHQPSLERVLRHRTALLAGAVLLPVEAASSWSVFSWYRFFEQPLPAVLVALAFCVLQVSLLMLAAQPLTETTHRWLLAGAAVLVGVTVIANVGGAYLHADTALPADILTGALGLGLGADRFTVVMAGVSGGAIPAVGLICWSALAQHLRNEREQDTAQRAALREAIRTLREKEAA
jgi:hypothetical protein